MVCVAAFIVLALLSGFVAILSIFRRDLGARYWKVFAKSWGCVAKKVRLQKCDTNFQEDVKNSILKHVVLKRPRLVKPISITIEVLSVLIVMISVWSLIEATKAGLSLYALGTCNLTTPSACSLGAESCTIDQGKPRDLLESGQRWLGEWGEIFTAIPEKFKTWQPAELLGEHKIYSNWVGERAESESINALEILDPLCVVCMQSFNTQEQSSFFQDYQTRILPYAITGTDGLDKFPNSALIVRFLYASNSLAQTDRKEPVATKILRRIFNEYDQSYVNYQTSLTRKTASEVETILKAWLTEFGLKTEEIQKITTLTMSEEMTIQLSKVNQLVKERLHAKGIPLAIYQNKKHYGLYKNRI